MRFINRPEKDANKHNRSLASVIEQYLTAVKPKHDTFIGLSLEFTDLFISYKKVNDVVVDLVATKILSLVN